LIVFVRAVDVAKSERSAKRDVAVEEIAPHFLCRPRCKELVGRQSEAVGKAASAEQADVGSESVHDQLRILCPRDVQTLEHDAGAEVPRVAAEHRLGVAVLAHEMDDGVQRQAGATSDLDYRRSLRQGADTGVEQRDVAGIEEADIRGRQAGDEIGHAIVRKIA
jgi:hypothetical protein